MLAAEAITSWDTSVAFANSSKRAISDRVTVSAVAVDNPGSSNAVTSAVK